MSRTDLDALERGCDEVESWPRNTATVTLSAPSAYSFEHYKPGVSVSIEQLRALVAELRACRFVASLAQEYVELEGEQPRQPKQFRDALLGNLRDALAALKAVQS